MRLRNVPENLDFHRTGIRSAFQISQRDDAAQASLRIDDRYAADFLSGHQLCAVLQIRVLVDGYGRTGHAIFCTHLFWILPMRHKTNHDVAISNDADRLVAMDDRDFTNVVVQHLAGHFAQVRGSGSDDGVLGHNGFDFH
jgi:hypothetical protein